MKQLAHRPEFYDEVRALLNQARQKAYASINFAMVDTPKAREYYLREAAELEHSPVRVPRLFTKAFALHTV